MHDKLYLYADDSILFAEVRTANDSSATTASLNKNLQRMKTWADLWVDGWVSHPVVTIDKKLTWSIKAYLQHYSSSRLEARSLEKGIKQAWCKRKTHCLQGPDLQCDGIRFVMLDECLVNHTPTPWLHPEQSSADHWCGCTAGQDTAWRRPFTL